MCLAVDENLLVVVILLTRAIDILPVGFVAITFLVLTILLVHQIQIKSIELLCFLINLVYNHVLNLKNVQFFYHRNRYINQRTKQKVVQVSC